MATTSQQSAWPPERCRDGYQARQDRQAAKTAKAPKLKTPSAASGPWISPVKPSADLLPRYIRARQKAQRTARVITVLAVAGLAAALAASAWAWLQQDSAYTYAKEQQQLEQTSRAEVSRLQPVAAYYDGLRERQDAVVAKMKDELDYARMLRELSTAAEGKATIESVTLAPQAPCPGPNPFAVAQDLGCLTVNVSSDNPAEAARFVGSLDASSDLWGSAYTTSSLVPTENSAGQVRYAVTVNYTAAALTLRHVPQDLKEQVLAEAQAGTGATTPATGGSVPVPTATPEGTS